MPRSSCSIPRVAEICSSLCTTKFSGSEPKESWLASVAVLSRVKLGPSMNAWPPGIGAFTLGAETTRPSSTIANWFCGVPSCAIRVVTSRNLAAPSESKSRFTMNWLVTAPVGVSFGPEVAPSRSVPSSSVGPSTYLAVPSVEHATAGFAGS